MSLSKFTHADNKLSNGQHVNTIGWNRKCSQLVKTGLLLFGWTRFLRTITLHRVSFVSAALCTCECASLAQASNHGLVNIEARSRCYILKITINRDMYILPLMLRAHIKASGRYMLRYRPTTEMCRPRAGICLWADLHSNCKCHQW